MMFDNKIMGSRGLAPLQGVLKGARSVLERQRSGAAPFFLVCEQF